jgi:hypothetical protein
MSIKTFSLKFYIFINIIYSRLLVMDYNNRKCTMDNKLFFYFNKKGTW